MPTIRRLSFIGLEYAFAPERAYGMPPGAAAAPETPGTGLVEISRPTRA